MEEKTNEGSKMPRGHRRSSKIILAAGALGALTVAVSIVVAIILLFFPVVEIEVEGDSRYSYSEVIEASGIKSGARLYYLNESKAEKRILEKLPYLERASVNSYFPNRVKIVIDQFDDIYTTYHEDGFCHINGDFEVLDIVSDIEDSYKNFSGIFIKLEKPISNDVGTVYEGEDKDRAIELINYLKEYGFYQSLNLVDVKHKYEVSFIAEKKYRFILGSMTDIEEKIDVSFKVCFTNDFKREENCIINSSDIKKVILRYVDDEMILAEFDFCEN